MMMVTKTQGRKTLFAAVEAYLEYKRGRAKSARTPELRSRAFECRQNGWIQAVDATVSASISAGVR